MRLKKLLCVIVTMAMVLSIVPTMTLTATASQITNPNDGDNYKVNVKADRPSDFENVAGIRFFVTHPGGTWAGFNGQFVYNGEGIGHNAMTWGGTGDPKDITAEVGNLSIAWYSSTPIFSTTDGWAEFVLTGWGGGITVDSYEFLDIHGNVYPSASECIAVPVASLSGNNATIANVSNVARVVTTAGHDYSSVNFSATIDGRLDDYDRLSLQWRGVAGDHTFKNLRLLVGTSAFTTNPIPNGGGSPTATGSVLGIAAVNSATATATSVSFANATHDALTGTVHFAFAIHAAQGTRFNLSNIIIHAEGCADNNCKGPAPADTATYNECCEAWGDCTCPTACLRCGEEPCECVPVNTDCINITTITGVGATIAAGGAVTTTAGYDNAYATFSTPLATNAGLSDYSRVTLKYTPIAGDAGAEAGADNWKRIHLHVGSAAFSGALNNANTALPTNTLIGNAPQFNFRPYGDEFSVNIPITNLLHLEGTVHFALSIHANTGAQYSLTDIVLHGTDCNGISCQLGAVCDPGPCTYTAGADAATAHLCTECGHPNATLTHTFNASTGVCTICAYAPHATSAACESFIRVDATNHRCVICWRTSAHTYDTNGDCTASGCTAQEGGGVSNPCASGCDYGSNSGAHWCTRNQTNPACPMYRGPNLEGPPTYHAGHASHSLVNGVCSVCGYATSPCPGCGGAGWTWGGNETTHWADNCSCTWNEAHNFNSSGVCTVCGYVRVNACAGGHLWVSINDDVHGCSRDSCTEWAPHSFGADGKCVCGATGTPGTTTGAQEIEYDEADFIDEETFLEMLDDGIIYIAELLKEGGTVVSAELLQVIKENGEDITVVLENGMTFTIIADSITADAKAFDLNIEIELLSKAEEVQGVKLPANSMVISPNFVGAFGFEIEFKFTAAQLAAAGVKGNNLKLWYVDYFGQVTDSGKLKINSDGSVEFKINSASYYVLSEEAPISRVLVVEENPGTGISIAVASFILVGGTAAIFRKRRVYNCEIKR
ncbi:MAG: hypothetical protein FWD34_09105 [Oscillospiraceae bacterium]|nr:hypothetical protein [Oscillospiraceae bacterium]